MPDDESIQLPQLDTVMEPEPLDIAAHMWVQRGGFIEDNCNVRRPDCYNGGIPIPAGNMLIKTDNGYTLIDEVTRL